MKKILLFVLLLCIYSMWTSQVYGEGLPIVISVSDYKFNPSKYDEISEPDIYFDIEYNGTVIETSDPIRDSNFHSFGEMKPFGDFCQGINELSSGDNITIKFYDSDYDTKLVKRFWEWVQSLLYKYIVYFGKQVELMNDPNKKYDDYDAYKAATEDPELKHVENNLTDNVMAINNRRYNKREFEYIGEVSVNVEQVIADFQSGAIQHATDYNIVNPTSSKRIGKINLIIIQFEGFGASFKVKGY
jgi:hypothetical protein